METGNTGDADKVLDEAITAAQMSGDRCHEAELHRLKGELAERKGARPEVLEQHFIKAIDTAREQGSKAWELRTTISLARLHERHGHRTNARDMLGSIYKSFTEGSSTVDLREAEILLAQLQSV